MLYYHHPLPTQALSVLREHEPWVDDMIAVLCNRNFSLLVAAQTITFTGSYVLFVGLPFSVYALTGSGPATGALFMAPTIPQLAFGSVAGVFELPSANPT
jgi:hypothetical protein